MLILALKKWELITKTVFPASGLRLYVNGNFQAIDPYYPELTVEGVFGTDFVILVQKI
jgi:hypothetical protein